MVPPGGRERNSTLVFILSSLSPLDEEPLLPVDILKTPELIETARLCLEEPFCYSCVLPGFE